MLAAQTFPAGEFIREEMDARGWTEDRLADRAILPLDEVQEILAGGRVDARASIALGRAFGVDDTFFARLDLAHRRAK